MKVCECEVPRDVPDPRRSTCMNCQGVIVLPEWESNDRNHGDFFERLAESSFPAYTTTGDKQHIPRQFFNFYRQCSGRERAGREKFGVRYLSRNNPAEAQEEAADLANYLYMEGLRRRRNGEDEESDALLTGALYAYKAYEICQRLANHNWKSLSDSDEELADQTRDTLPRDAVT